MRTRHKETNKCNDFPVMLELAILDAVRRYQFVRPGSREAMVFGGKIQTKWPKPPVGRNPRMCTRHKETHKCNDFPVMQGLFRPAVAGDGASGDEDGASEELHGWGRIVW